MGGGKKYFRSRGKGEIKSQGFFLCPALSQSPTVPLESAPAMLSSWDLGCFWQVQWADHLRLLRSPPQPCSAYLPFRHPHAAQLLDGEEKAQDCRFHFVDLGGSGPDHPQQHPVLSRLGPDHQDHYGNSGKSQPLQTLFSSPALLLAVCSEGVHSWVDDCENPQAEEAMLCMVARHHRLSSPHPHPAQLPLLPRNALLEL